MVHLFCKWLVHLKKSFFIHCSNCLHMVNENQIWCLPKMGDIRHRDIKTNWREQLRLSGKRGYVDPIKRTFKHAVMKFKFENILSANSRYTTKKSDFNLNSLAALGEGGWPLPRNSIPSFSRQDCYFSRQTKLFLTNKATTNMIFTCYIRNGNFGYSKIIIYNCLAKQAQIDS
jgi:hypothetical protein